MTDRTDDEVQKQLLARMGWATMGDLDAEMAWARSLVSFQAANLEMMRRIGERAIQHPGMDRSAPMREQLAEMPGGTYMVARFDHVAAVNQLLAEITAEHVGFFGPDEP